MTIIIKQFVNEFQTFLFADSSYIKFSKHVFGMRFLDHYLVQVSESTHNVVINEEKSRGH